MIRLWPLAALLSLAACKRDAPKTAPAPPPATKPGPPSWPRGLTDGLAQVRIVRTRANEPTRAATVRLGGDGIWRMESPRRGEADPDAMGRLKLAIEAPQLIALAAAPSGPVEFEIELGYRSGKSARITTRQAPLEAAVPITIHGVGDFAASPVEFSTKLPDPADFLPPGLWISAGVATSLEVKGPASYRLIAEGGVWRSADGRRSRYELEDLPGVITSRQAITHPDAPPRSLGLEAPVATTTLCVAERCRTIKLGQVNSGGVTRYYAQAPDADPIELRDSEWKLLVEGPWPKEK